MLIVYPQAVTLLLCPQVWSVCFFFMIILSGIESAAAFLVFPQNFLQCFFVCCPHNNLSSIILHFVALESIITSLSDVYPSDIRKGYCRELLLMLICAFSYTFGLLLVSEVSCKKYIHWWPHKQFIM